MYEDKTLVCKDCGAEFVFTAGEQEFYAQKGFQNQPQRCKACREAKRNAGKVLYTAVCAECGKEAKVPFQPSNDKPVYCSECFAARTCRSASLFAAFTSIEFTAGVCIIVFVNCFGDVLLRAKCFCLRINECGVDFGQIYYFFTLGLRQLFEFCSVSKGLFYIRYYEVGVFYHPMISF